MSSFRMFVKALPALILASLALSLPAAYINQLPTRVTQPDGSELDLFASGDEFHNWLHDADNFTVIPDDATGWYRYAVKDGESVRAGSLTPGIDDPRASGLNPGVNISANLYKQRRATRFYSPGLRDAPTTGTINNLVVYIRFSDESEFSQPISTYEGWFNSSPNSLRNYYLEASYNQLTVNTSFYPAPANNFVVSWQDIQPRAYYQPYNASTNPGGYTDDDDRRNREFSLLVRATNGIAGLVPAGLTIDSDNDGRVDNVVYIVRGSAGAWASLLWPHRWSLYDRNVYINGKRVYDFNFQIQNSLTTRAVGILCHEFFHSLGAPDLYHYESNGITPAGTWDIMQTDEDPPQHMTAFMKWKYGDWIPSIPTISADGVYALNSLTSPTGQCYRIASPVPSQYYVVEFRKKTGTFESSIPGSGLLVYRIDTSCGNGNADGPPDELYIYRPNGTTTANGTITSANYSAETGRTAIHNGTTPTPFLQDGSAGNLYLCEIGSSAGTQLTFRLGQPFVNFEPNPYSQSFDANIYPPEGWTSAAETGSYAFTRVTSGGNPSCGPQSGAGMLRYNSDIAPAGNSAYVASPRIVCADPSGYGYQVSFWMYRDGNLSTYQDRLEVYSNASPDLSGTPTLLGTIFRNRNLAPAETTPGWKQYSFALPFTAAGEYYAVLRAVSASGYNIYIDSAKIAKVPLAAISPSPAANAPRVLPTAQLTWQNGGGAPTGYKLWLGTNNPPSNIVNGADLGDVLGYAPTLLSNTTYHWKVAPYNLAGSANACPVWSFTTIAENDLMSLNLQGQDYCLAGDSLEFAVTVSNNGLLTQASYLVKLHSADGRTELASLQVDSPLALDQSATHLLSWPSPPEGSHSVYASVTANADEIPANDASSTELATVCPPSTYIPVAGAGQAVFTTNSLPFNFYWKNSLSETVYLASDLQMTAGNITGIVYVNDFTQYLSDKPVKLWLKNTPAADVASGWLPFDGYALVFDGVIDFPAGVNEVLIPLDQPFAYTGANLALRCNRPLDSVYFNISNRFQHTVSTLHPSRSRYLYSDSTVFDPAAPATAGTLSNHIPLTGFIVTDASPLALPAPELTFTQTGESLQLGWPVRPGYHGYRVFASDDPSVWPDDPVATVYAPAYQTPLDSVRRFFRVVAFSYPGGLRGTADLPALRGLLYVAPEGERGPKD